MIRRRIPAPALIVMGLLATVCGLALAEVLSAEFGAQSSGPPAALKPVTTPAGDLGKLRQTAVKAAPSHKARRHKRVHRARKHHFAPARAAPATVAQVEPPTSGYQQTSPQPYRQTAQPVQQLGAPSNPAPVRAAPKKAAPKPSGGGGSFDDSG
jgi:hypothetical protein